MVCVLFFCLICVWNGCNFKTFIDKADDDDGDNDSNGDDGDDILDQDEDVIQDAEEVQEEDLEEAADATKGAVVVAEHKQNAASTALSKVSSVTTTLGYECLLIAYSLPNLHTKSTTLLACSKNLRHCVKMLVLNHSEWWKPVDMRWNSKSLMISRTIHLKPAIEDICSRNSLTKLYNTHSLRLKQEEWVILEYSSALVVVMASALALALLALMHSFF